MAEAKAFDPTSLLQKKASDVKPPQRLPVGTYLCTVIDREFEKVGEKQNTVVRYTYRYDEALPDVDAADLAIALDESQGGKPLGEYRDRTLDFFITPDALWRLTRFNTDHCGVDPDLSVGEQIEEVKNGKQFLATRTLVENKQDPSKPYINVTSTAAVPS